MLTPRDYVIEEYTKTVCPECAAEHPLDSQDPATWLDGMLIIRDNTVYLTRNCPTHGWVESLYEEDAGLWQSRRGWSTPTLAVTPDRPDNHKSFPEGYVEGLPAGHGQHSCIVLLNLTEHCNYACPTCYAAALDPATQLQQPLRPTIEEIDKTVDTMIEREQGKLGVLMLSGGEPTVRRDILDILNLLKDKPITRIMLNTNGRRLARDDAFLKALSGFKDRLEIYLQFDGLEPDVLQKLRGEDLAQEKIEVIRRLGQAGIYHTFVMTIARGVNEHLVGEVVKTAMDTPFCAGAALQPMFGSGRNPGFDPADRTTPTAVRRRLEEQTDGDIQATDFVPLPCSHRDCCDIAYFVKTKEGWQSLVRMVGNDQLKDWIHLAANTISFENASETVKSMVKEGVLQRLLSEQQAPSSLRVAADMFRLCGCVPGLTEAIDYLSAKTNKQDKILEKLAQSTFRLTIKQFMDAHTFHEARIRQCCVHVGTFEEDPRRYSFCWRYVFQDATDFPAPREGLTSLKMLS